MPIAKNLFDQIQRQFIAIIKYFFSVTSGAPTTTDDVSNAGGSNDEMHIVVVDEDGGITGTANTVLEVFEGVSQASDAKDESDPKNIYDNKQKSKKKN